MHKRMNLVQAKALFLLPPPLKAASIPTDAAMQVYMDPWLVPAPRYAHVRPQTPQQYRIRTAQGVAGVFMAQYQFQHELPPHMMQRGVLTCLVQQEGVVRHFAGPEISSIHGAALPVFLHADARTQMRMLGNSIAVPHAIVPLVRACEMLGKAPTPEPAEAVAWSLRARLHAQNSVLLPFGQDWVLCHRSQIDQVLRCHCHPAQAALQAPAPDAFIEVRFQAPSGTCMVQAPPDIAPPTFFSFMGCPELMSPQSKLLSSS